MATLMALILMGGYVATYRVQAAQHRLHDGLVTRVVWLCSLGVALTAVML